ncbi:MAG: M20/M25/M40 family metallo-hydrolase [Acidobacteriota bacterium]
MMRTSAASVLATVLLTLTLAAQGPSALDPATIARVRDEASTRSKVYEHVWWLSEVYGPRATGTPAFAQASDWAMKQFREWGLANVHQERWAFGQGWSIQHFSVTLTEPQPAVLIGAPRNYSPSTAGLVASDVVRVQIGSEADFAKYAGKLRGKIVVMQPTRAVRMLEGPVILRMDDGPYWTEAATPVEPAPAVAPPAGAAEAARARQQLAQAIQKFLVAEGVGVLLERGNDADTAAGGSDLTWRTQMTDGGTIFPGSGGSRDAQAAVQVPSATLAVEHYNRLIRLLDHNLPVKMEVNIQTTFHPEGAQPNGINTIAEIPGTDLASEVVIMGAHLDSVPYATGATDNATGSAAMMEAVRAIQALGLKPRRTIRVALWGGEEQGLLGSRAYVAAHFWDNEANKPKPEHAGVAAYFNLDNGTGRIRGIWGQGNKGALPIFEKWGEPLKGLGWKMASPRSVAATDRAAFDGVGLPGFQFIQERLEYNSRSHHSNMDTFDRVQKADAEQQGTVAAVFAWQAANWAEKLPRKPMTR